VDHSKAFHDFRGHTTNDVEAFWSVLKRTIRAYRQISEVNLPPLLGEVEFRYNRRNAAEPLFDEIASKFNYFENNNLRAPVSRFVW
jgi:hypothetical protein